MIICMAMRELAIAKKAAREAGRLLLFYFGNLKDIRFKSGRRDPVSEADKASEALIARTLKAAFPFYGFLGEEDTAWQGEGGRWIVDPLDGTVNYSHCFPCFCVSIAYERDGEIVVGVVHDPVRRETFHAVKGKGAFLNGKRLNVSKTPKLANSLIVTGFPYDIDRHADKILGLFNKMTIASQGMRRLGSAALDLCYIAAGRFDGYWEFGLKPWDTAAGALIVSEAGGRVTALDGEPFHFMDSSEILVSNSKIHNEMIKVMAK
jgi:myo-inositol-1(or 4)-monophosphatase